MESPKKYQQIYTYLREKIEQNQYDEKGRLESESELCQRFSASRLTVRQATQMLEQEGLVYRRKGSGTYVRGFVPMAASGHRQRHNRIGLIVPTINDPSYADFEAIEENLINNGYSVLLRSTNHKFQSERDILNEFMELGVDAILVSGTRSALPNANAMLYEQLRQQSVPVTFLNEPHRDMAFPYTAENDTDAAEMLVEHLVSIGHKKIACLFALDTIQGLNRYTGYCRGLLNNALEYSDAFVSLFTSGDELRAVNSFQPGNCTACICQNDRVADLLIKHLKDSGLRVPEDFSVVGMDGSVTAVGEQPITTAVHLTDEISQQAIRTLLDAIGGVTPLSRTFDMPFRPGTTSAPPKNQNPVISGDWADPFILCDEGNYYLYPTHRWDGSEFFAFHSENLLHWSAPKKIMDLENVPWASESAWSPSVIRYKDKYYMVYTASKHLGFAWSDSPTGPFTNLSQQPFLSPSITALASSAPFDPHLFIDNGRPYMLYGLPKCWMVPLNIDGERIAPADEPICLSDRLVTEQGEPFPVNNKNDFNGCTRVIRIGKRYLLTWSRYDTRDPRCHICYAWADTLEGPYVIPENSVLITGNDDIHGTGHGCIVEYDGGLFLFYHRINQEQEMYRQEVFREICVDPIEIREDGTLVVIPT